MNLDDIVKHSTDSNAREHQVFQAYLNQVCFKVNSKGKTH